jgi:hypothetical protein
MKTFLLSLGRLWNRFPGENRQLVAHFAGEVPPTIPQEMQHKLKIYTWLSGSLLLVLA